MSLWIDFPWQFDISGNTAVTTRRDHVRDLLLQLLFTAPGERVNRPDFGVGLYRLCFEENAHQSTDLLRFILQSRLQQWLGDDVEVIGLAVQGEGATLAVEITYQLRDEPCPPPLVVTRRGIR